MTAECRHTHPSRPAAVELKRLLADAERRCADAGQRWTEPRRRVFELLVRAGTPVKAYDLIADYDEHAPGSTKPPTVYRALEFLEGAGFAHRIPSLNAYVACAEVGAVHAASFMICDCCGSAVEFDAGVAELATAMAEARHFRPRSASVEVRGMCEACAAAKDASGDAAGDAAA